MKVIDGGDESSFNMKHKQQYGRVQLEFYMKPASLSVMQSLQSLQSLFLHATQAWPIRVCATVTVADPAVCAAEEGTNLNESQLNLASLHPYSAPPHTVGHLRSATQTQHRFASHAHQQHITSAVVPPHSPHPAWPPPVRPRAVATTPPPDAGGLRCP